MQFMGPRCVVCRERPFIFGWEVVQPGHIAPLFMCPICFAQHLEGPEDPDCDISPTQSQRIRGDFERAQNEAEGLIDWDSDATQGSLAAPYDGRDWDSEA